MRNICLRGKQLPPTPHPQFQYPERMLPWARLPHTCCFPAPPHQTYQHPQQASSKEERKSLLKTSLLPSPESHARHSLTPLCFLEKGLEVGNTDGHRTWTIQSLPSVLCSDPPPPEDTVKVGLFKPWYHLGLNNSTSRRRGCHI